MTQTATIQQTRTDLFIRMSSAGRCRRQTGYELLGDAESDPTPVEGKNVMDLGDGAEAILVQRLTEEGWEVDLTRWAGGDQMEVRLDDPPRVGHPDGRCRHPALTHNLWVLLECKGMNAFQYRAFLRDGISKSHPQYVDQVGHYATALHRMGLVAVPDVAVVAALDRDSGRWSYQRVRWDADVFTRRTAELAELWEAVSHGDLPERDHDGATWHCSPRFCRWSSLCWEGTRPFPATEEVGDGLLEIEDPAERRRLTAFADTWREGKEMEVRGKEMQTEVKDLFRNTLSLQGAKKLAIDGLAATLVSSSRKSWDEKQLRRILTEEQLRDAQKVTESTSLRVVDTRQDAS